MAHENAGQYAAKHPEGTTLNEKIAEKVNTLVVEGEISCGEAHAVAHELGVSPKEVGVTIDLMELRINQCLLGLFGYSPEGKVVTPAESVSPQLRAALEAEKAKGGVSCEAAWGLAERFNLRRLEVSSACEALGMKIVSCQLGTFGK